MINLQVFLLKKNIFYACMQPLIDMQTALKAIKLEYNVVMWCNEQRGNFKLL